MLSAEIIHRLTMNDPIPDTLGGADGWLRTYGRCDADGTATLLYERDGLTPALRTVRLGQGGDEVPGLGRLTVKDWDDDKALPMLSGIRQHHPGLLPVRYRPGKRCTFKSTGRNSYYAKVVADGRGAEIIRNGQLLWSAYVEGRLGFAVARPAGWLPSLNMIVHHAVSGKPVIDALHGTGGAALAGQMGAANATLAQSGLTPAIRYDYAFQLKRTAKYARRIARWLPASGALLDEIMARLSRIEGGPADKPIHGAPHAHQWLGDGSGLALIDFDRFGLGDPELDVATFLAEWDFESGAHGSEVGAAFAQAFADAVTLDHALIEAYRIHKHVAKALRTLAAIRIDVAEQSLQILKHAAMRARGLG